MAFISPTAGSPISMSDILSKMGLSTVNRSLGNAELSAMGGPTQSVASQTNALCMPYQLEAVASLGSTGTGAPGANWTATTTLWRPNRFSEFRNAYNTKPQVSGSATGTGDSSTCNLNVNASNSEAYTGISTPYYFYTTGSGSFAGKNVWVIADSNNGQSKSYGTVTGLGGSGSWSCYVQDFSGCGNRFDFSTTITY